ncbi:helix-turn-helix transcriptional regulator [Streptomyces axinellae]|uniref:Acyltransferase n=1 Tax=Streptomyces axinellae TaxID=552788 RepID=A0ABN3QYU7_9ACTN
MMSTEEMLRATVAALLSRTGERQAELAGAVGLSATALSRRQSGRATWSLDDVDRLSAHWGIAVPDLLTGITHAVDCLPTDRLPATPATPATGPPAADELPSGTEPEQSPTPLGTGTDTPPAPAPAPAPTAAPARSRWVGRR